MRAPLLVVTPWYPSRQGASALDAAVAATVDAAVRAGGNVNVLHLVPRSSMDEADAIDDAAVRVRRVEVGGGLAPGDPAAVEAIAALLAEHAEDLLGRAEVVHAHAAVPVAAAVARVVPEGARLVVSEHLPSAFPLLAASADDGAMTAAWQAVLTRADAVLAPSEHLLRRLVHCAGAGSASGSASSPPPRAGFEVLPYAPQRPARPARPAVGHAADGTDEALPATRWLLLEPLAAGESVVRALAADALAGAPTTLTVAAAEDDAAAAGLAALAARFGVERRLVRIGPGALLGLLAGRAVDLAVGPDPLAAADPALTAALAAGVRAVLARGAGSEELVDEVAATGALRAVRPGAGAVELLEAVADLRRGGLARPAGSLLAPWRTWPATVAESLARHHGEGIETPWRCGPRVLLVDLAGRHRNEIGDLARWVVTIGGEPLVVTAAAPPPSSGVPGAVSIDLRALERELARQPLRRVRRRLPGVARPALDGALAAYRTVRRRPALVDAALTGPLAAGTGPSPEVDAVVAADDAGAELARRWTGTAVVLPPDVDRVIAHVTAARAGSVAGSVTATSRGTGGS